MNSNVNLNIGSKVRIKNKKWYESMKNYIGIILPSDKVSLVFNKEMAKYCGKIVTIIEDEMIRLDCGIINYYRIDLDGSRWKWSDDMFDTIYKGIEIE